MNVFGSFQIWYVAGDEKESARLKWYVQIITH